MRNHLATSLYLKGTDSMQVKIQFAEAVGRVKDRQRPFISILHMHLKAGSCHIPALILSEQHTIGFIRQLSRYAVSQVFDFELQKDIYIRTVSRLKLAEF